ncbi:MAG: hypothetical protein WBP16_15345 [Ferruginibacter sp.]
MRSLIISLLLVPVISFTAEGQFINKKNELNGIWVPVRQELGGTELPAAGFAKHKLIIEDTVYTYVAESTEIGVLKFSGNKLDIYGKEGVNTGRHFATIYKYENELLTICYNLQGDSYPESFETTGKGSFFISAFKREVSK